MPWTGRKRDERLHARVPGLRRGSAHRFFAGQAGMRSRPARRLDDLQRIGRRHEDLREERVRVKSDRREHLVEFLLAERGRARRGWRRGHLRHRERSRKCDQQ